ncbi:sulfate transporter family-domain-containing protein [Umbelopsis sp. AD052]|nr:sulfate transporter family-domain-containing protein [Umbelopsis sp. AD052]
MSTIYIDKPTPPTGVRIKNAIKNTPHAAKNYFTHLLPIVHWLPKYNLQWLAGDLVCGITVGAVIVPQSMAYAKIAGLPPQFGLYSSFVGVVIYCLFATSKDISIGTTAIMSLLVSQIISSVMAETADYTAPQIAVTLALFGGFIVFFIGIIRLGLLVDFICQPTITGFMAGSALTIIINQSNQIFGITGIDTHQAPYLVFGKTLAGLGRTQVDAAFGLGSLVFLYSVKFLCAKCSQRYPKHARKFFYVNVARNAVLVIFTTLLSYLITMHQTTSPFHVLGPVPAGFQGMEVPVINTHLLSLIASKLPSVVVLLIMEHVAIAKSLGKMTDYKIDVDQEIISIGLTNIIASFFSAYPSTGSFSRSAVMSKSGARTPLVGLFVAVIVVLALYALTPAFYYIPTAALAAVIIHAVSDLIAGPSVWKRLWSIHPWEFMIFLTAMVITLFTSVDLGIYVPVALSLVIQLYRTARPAYSILGKLVLQGPKQSAGQEQTEAGTMYYPMSHPSLKNNLTQIAPGIIAFRPEESLIFQNVSFVFDKLTDEIKLTTKRGVPLPEAYGDRAWNEAMGAKVSDENLPLLRAVVMDLSGIHQMDSTGTDALVETARQAERYSGQTCRWHFVGVEADTVRRGLLASGFGLQRHGTKTFFINDFVNMEEKGHRYGDEGCLKRVSTTNLNSNPSQWDAKEKNPAETITTVEDVEKGLPIEAVSEQHNAAGSSSAMDDAAVSTDDASEYCRCHLGSTVDVGEPIGLVRDKWPYFHQTMEEAVGSAVLGL